MTGCLAAAEACALEILPVEIGRHTAAVAEAAAGPTAVDGCVRQQMTVVDQFLDGDAFPDDTDTETRRRR